MSKIVFVTGAKGFLGRYCARRLSLNGWSVSGIGHGAWDQAEWTQWGLKAWIPRSVTLENLLYLESITGSPDLVVHCAGSSSVNASYLDPKGDFVRTVLSMVDVLEYSRLKGVSVPIIYPSSAAVYGDTNGLPCREDMPLAPISPYGVYKMNAEQCCCMYANEWGIPVTVIRFFSLYGGGLRKQLLWDACLKAVNEDFVFFGQGQDVRDWLDVRDASRLIEAIARQALSGFKVINGGTGVGVTVREVLEFLGALFSPSKLPVFSGQPKSGDPSALVADTSSLEAINFSPEVSWKEGLSSYVNWFKAAHL